MELDAEPRFLSRGPLLALDTSTDCATVVLDACEDHLHEAPRGSSRQHGRGLLASVRDLLRQAGIRPADLTAVGVGLGPGSFTGLRIGLTAAKTLAYAIGCPLYGVDTLEAIARNAPDDALSVIALGDAQRGDFFVADFARDRAGEPLRRTRPTRLERATSWPATLTPGTHVLGPPLGRVEPAWPTGVGRGDVATAYPDGRRLIDLVRERMAAGPAEEAWFLEPLYARGSAAEETAAGTGVSPPILGISGVSLSDHSVLFPSPLEGEGRVGGSSLPSRPLTPHPTLPLKGGGDGNDPGARQEHPQKS